MALKRKMLVGFSMLLATGLLLADLMLFPLLSTAYVDPLSAGAHSRMTGGIFLAGTRAGAAVGSILLSLITFFTIRDVEPETLKFLPMVSTLLLLGCTLFPLTIAYGMLLLHTLTVPALAWLIVVHSRKYASDVQTAS